MAVIQGTDNDDTLDGTEDNDTIYGKGGADLINGFGGDDSLDGGGLDDILWGGSGNDNLYGKSGLDFLYGGDGNDSMHGDGGTDVLYGEAGNDILKGGLGEATLIGGSGKDDIYYNPFKGKISDINNSLSGSHISGDSGYDTLNIFNETTYTDWEGKKQNGWTYIGINEDNSGTMYFEGKPGEYDAPWAHIGTFSGIEEIKVEGTGGGGLKFYGGSNQGFKVTGTDTGDDLVSFGANDTLLGGGGNDYFFFNGGDKIESWTKDADKFYFADYANGGAATLTGFNGAGKAGGDELTMSVFELANPDTQVVESGGKTTFTLNSGDSLQVDAVGMVLGEDWFLV